MRRPGGDAAVMISGGEVGGLAASRLQQAQSAGKRSTAPVGSGTGGEAPAAAGAQTRAGQLVAAVRALPDVRPEKVAAASARLASGQQPSSTDVARQILRRVAADRQAGG